MTQCIARLDELGELGRGTVRVSYPLGEVRPKDISVS